LSAKQPQKYQFSKEDSDITKNFGLKDLKDSYDGLVPESIALKVAEAYKHIIETKNLGEQYLQSSVLGRKISGIISQDYNFIFGFIRQI